MPVRIPSPPVDANPVAHLNDPVLLQTLGPALDLGVTEHDELAQLAALCVTAVEASAEGVEIRYVVRWQAFHACDDRTVWGESLRVARGRREGADWVFQAHSPLHARDSVDEF